MLMLLVCILHDYNTDMASKILDVIRDILRSIVYGSVLFALISAISIIAMPKLVDYFSVLDKISATIPCALVVFVIIFYLFNLKQINRSLDEVVNRDRVCVIITLIALTQLFAIDAGQLVPKLIYMGPVWGWISFLLILLLIPIFVAKYFTRSSKKVTESSLHLDDPSDTRISLTNTQEIVYDRIKTVLDRTADISVALTGNWGTGKTKILYKIKNELPDETLWFSFYPWAYTSEEALIKDFYIQLIGAIDKRIPRFTHGNGMVSASINRLIDSKVMRGVFSFLLGLTVESGRNTQSPEDIIAKRLISNDLNIIVVVDDLERVKDDAIINRSLQLVHHLKRRGIKGISFITAFEREAVLEALPLHVKEEEKSVFIEKFFDMEIMLPDPLPADLEEQLIDQIPKPLMPSYVRQVLLKDLKSHRAVIRLANEYELSDSLKSSGIDLNKIVNMDDFLVLTHLKLKYPFVYRDISQNRHIYTQHESTIDDEDAIAYQFMQPEEQNRSKREHIEQLLNAYNLKDNVASTVKSMLSSIFPDLAAAMGESSSRSNGFDTQRRERRLGIRVVLDAALGVFSEMTKILDHEKMVSELISLIEGEYTEEKVQAAIDSIVQYAIDIEGEGWDAVLHILTSEISNRDELSDSIPVLTKCLIRAGLELDIVSDNNGTKVRILGQACYIFTDNLLYRGFGDAKKRKFVEELSLTELITHSKTPYGSLLLSNLELSREARDIKGRLSENERNVLRVACRQHFESYYIDEHHDIVKENSENTSGLFTYLDNGWYQTTKKYSRGIALMREWKAELQSLHPGYFLDEYTTKTYRGNWAFKEKDFGTIRPVQDITSEKLNELMNLVNAVEGSGNLSEDDIARIKMVKQYAEQKQVGTNE